MPRSRVTSDTPASFWSRWWWVPGALTFLLYFALLAHSELTRPNAPGLHVRFGDGVMDVRDVDPASPAGRAGLRAGDRVVFIDGRPIGGRLDWQLAAANLDDRSPVRLTIDRAGQRTDATLLLGRAPWRHWLTREGLSHVIVRFVQFLTLLCAIIVAFKRPGERVAMLGAWALATVGVFSVDLPFGMATTWRRLPAAIGAALWFPYMSSLAVSAIIFTFFAQFPRAMIRGWKTWLPIWTPMLLALIPQAQFGAAMVYAPTQPVAGSFWMPSLFIVTIGYVAATLISMIASGRTLADVTERRRMRVLVFGAMLGLVGGLPVVLLFWWRSSADLTHSLFASPLYAAGMMVLLALPASFTYAILRHRLFDLGLIIRRGVQYALARGVLVSIVPMLGVLLAADVLVHHDDSVGTVLRSRGWIYAALAGLAVLARTQRHRWLDALDRRFFRERYDSHRLLRDLARQSRTATRLTDVAPVVAREIDRALHPTFTALLRRDVAATAFDVVAMAPPDRNRDAWPADARLLAIVRALGKPVGVGPDDIGRLARDLPEDERTWIERCELDLVVPIAFGAGEDEWILALGARRSEEPYSQEDRDLLIAIAEDLAVLARVVSTQPPASADAPTVALTPADRVAQAERVAPATSVQWEAHVRECPSCGACADADAERCAHDATPLVAGPVPRLLARRYRLDRKLARGGMGTVYEAFDLSLERAVAVKVLRPELMSRADAARRFEREARVAAALTHPHIVTVHDFGVIDGSQCGFLIMECLRGETLRDRLWRVGRLDPAPAIAILRPVASAIDAAHERHLVHRDLKPENVFLVDVKGSPLPKVLDFGLARALTPEDADDRLTQSGVFMGTPQYMAPEQLRGERPDVSWDRWALALMAYEMLTGHVPFAGPFGALVPEAPDAALARGLGGPLAGARDAFADALALDPVRRPASAVILIERLAVVFAPGAEGANEGDADRLTDPEG